MIIGEWGGIWEREGSVGSQVCVWAWVGGQVGVVVDAGEGEG